MRWHTKNILRWMQIKSNRGTWQLVGLKITGSSALVTRTSLVTVDIYKSCFWFQMLFWHRTAWWVSKLFCIFIFLLIIYAQEYTFVMLTGQQYWMQCAHEITINIARNKHNFIAFKYSIKVQISNAIFELIAEAISCGIVFAR